jgi:hypothetical protein
VELILVAAAVALVIYLVTRSRRRAPAPVDPPADPAETAVPTFRVVALGTSGAGKTVLLASMFHELNHVTRTRSYELDTRIEDRMTLSGIHQQVSDSSRPWPSATGRSLAETREFVFDCVGRDDRGRRRSVARISYLDFAGVLLEDGAHTDSDAFRRLLGAVENASALLVLIDGRRVRQLLDNDPSARSYFTHTMGTMLALAQRSTCPMHFVITKWDLLQDMPVLRGLDDATRLDRVVDALTAHPQIAALVYAAGPGRIVRMIPVSSVGPAFVELDRSGRVVKRADGELQPTNVDVPLAAVVPDIFRQVEAELDTSARRSLQQGVAGLGSAARGLASRFGSLLSGPVGIAMQVAMGSYFGPVGDGVSALFVDWAGRRQDADVIAASNYREQQDQQLALVRSVRARVLDDFTRAVHRIEDHYPTSLLHSGHWTDPR